MESDDFLLRQAFKNNVGQHSEQSADDAIILWEKIADQIISIVGEGGFNSLYGRSVFITQKTFSWLTAASLPPKNDHRFAELRMHFERQTLAQASAANNLLLITFTDLLASLIGEQLTVDILRSAWVDNDTDRAGKEFKNE